MPGQRASVTLADVVCSVLIVDDHTAFRASARALLEAEGYEVVAAGCRTRRRVDRALPTPGRGNRREVLSLMAEGRSNGAIGAALFLSPETVEAHIRQVFIKLGLRETPEYHRRVLAVLTFLRES